MSNIFTGVQDIVALALTDLFLVEDVSGVARRAPFSALRNFPLTGFVAGPATAVTAADTPLQAFQKHEARLALNDAKVTGADRVLKAGDTMTGLLQFSGTTHAGLKLISLTTVQRDALVGPAAGMFIYNLSTLAAEVYNGTAWTSSGGGVTDNTKVLKAGDTMTGALIMPVGSTATPSIGFTGDTNTGVYRATAGALGLVAGGTERVRVSGLGLGVGANYLTMGTAMGVDATLLSSFGLGGLQLGLNGSAPIGQIIRSCTPRPGTDANTNGSDFVLQAGLSTGSGLSGHLYLRTSLTGAAATTINGVQTMIELFGAKMGFFGAAAVDRPTGYAITNVVTTRAYNAASYTPDNLAHTLGTLIADLKLLGLLN